MKGSIVMPTIKIRKDSNCYTAIFVDGLPMTEAIEAFGTNEIPTGFTSKALYCNVIRTIKKLNPNCKVVFA